MKKLSSIFLSVLASLVINPVIAADALPGANSGSSWLINKIITPPAIPKNSDTSMITYGQDYYDCGGAMHDNGKSDLSITFLRKGRKTSCRTKNLVMALTRSSNNNKTHEFLDVIDIKIPKGYELSSSNCTNAVVAISKFEDVEFFKKHINAWIVQDNKFVSLANLKNVSCENMGYGV